MEIRKVLVLRGPNYWANFPVLEAWVDLGVLKDSPSDELPGFNERLMAWLPTMIEHRCSVGERRRFFRAAPPRHVSGPHPRARRARIADACRIEVGFGRTRETAEEGVYKVAIEFIEEAVGKASSKSARELCLAAVYDQPFDWPPRSLVGCARLTQQTRLGPEHELDRAGGSRPRNPGPPARIAAVSCSWDTARGSGASWPPRPTAPAPSPNRSLKTKN